MTRSDEEPTSPAEAERKVVDARADLEGSLDELGRKLDPDALLAQAKSFFARDGEDFGDVVIREARANPMAAIMVGTGLAWLMLGARRRTEARRAYGGTTLPQERTTSVRPVPASGNARGLQDGELETAERRGNLRPGSTAADERVVTVSPAEHDPSRS